MTFRTGPVFPAILRVVDRRIGGSWRLGRNPGYRCADEAFTCCSVRFCYESNHQDCPGPMA
jgi:cation diffusion facilitator CzcD-associated flavoprotein CzcO